MNPQDVTSLKNLRTLPLPVRLTLRDLQSRKRQTGAFAILIAVILGVLTPLIVAPQLSGFSNYARLLLADAPDYKASSTPGSLLIGSVVTSTSTLEEFSGKYPSVTAAADTPIWIPQVSGWIGKPENDFGIALIDSTDPVLSRVFTADSGRLPREVGEVALDLSWFKTPDTSVQLHPIPAIGDELILGTNNHAESVRVVGYFSSTLPKNAAIGPALAVPGSLIQDDSSVASLLLFNSTDLSLEAAKRLASHIGDNEIGKAFAVASDSSTNAFTYAHHVSTTTFDLRLWQTTSSMITLFFALLFVAVLGVPLFTLSTQRRSAEVLQLRRSGASLKTIWLSLLASSLIIAVTAAVLGLIFAFTALAIIFSELPNQLLFTPGIVLTVAGLSFTGAFGSAFIASAIPTSQLLRKIEGPTMNSTSSKTDNRWAWPTVGTGISLLVIGASFEGLVSGSLTSVVLMCTGAVLILVGIYLIIPRIMNRMVSLTGSSPLLVRIAVRELATKPIFSTNAIVPVAFISSVLTTFGIITRQHLLEDNQIRPDTYAMVFPLLWIPIGGALLMVMLALGASLMGLSEIRAARTTLTAMGQDTSDTSLIEGYRAALLVGVGTFVGTIAGMLFAMTILLYRLSADNLEFLPVPGALWAWETYLIVLVIPPIVCYLVGRRIGLRANTELTVHQQHQLV
ncbi:ABC transporter permease [Jonesiaceae bacterium BS-20]|uniref:ABC transporter permease n=1 Tax=Jonesiaceae bacterium BS-20 TaxID=3120821 RepID=A0AAU7DTI2_9MICO